MLYSRALFVISALAPLVLAQDDNNSNESDLTAGLFEDFPIQCLDSCMAMEDIVKSCSTIADPDQEAESFACVCNTQFINSLETCGSCVIPAAGVESKSGSTIAQMAIGVSQGCGMGISIEGIEDERISSILASPSQTSSPTSASQSEVSSGITSLTFSTSMPSSFSSSTLTSSTSSTSNPSQTETAQNSATSFRTGVAASVFGMLVVSILTTRLPSRTSFIKDRRPVATTSIPLLDTRDTSASTPFNPSLVPSEMSTSRQILNTGSLKDRIAKLNLQDSNTSNDPTATSSTSPRSGTNSGPPSPSAVRTGATSKISDKISRFQVNAEKNALLPSGGSFGLAPARPSGSKDRGNEKPRVASLGAGRAPVPLNVVKPTRSVSAGNVGSRSASENGSVGSGQDGRKADSVGSGGGIDSRPTTPAAESRPGSIYETAVNETPTSSTGPTTLLLDNQPLSNLLAPGPRTPGAMSVSSMNVETGSIASEGDRNPSETDLTPSLVPSEPAEPSEIPALDSQTQGSPLPTPSIGSSSDDAPPTPPALPVKGPLEHLRQPSRSGSIASMSSLVVEAPPEDVADLEAMSNSGRPSTTSEAAAESGDRTVVTPIPTDDGNDEEEGDERRLERTNEELKKYENDQEDPTAHGPGPEEEGGLPVRPTWDADEENSTMPKVKCSDCDASVDLVELADHSCTPSRQAPSLTSPPASPATRKVALTDASSSRDDGEPTSDSHEDAAPTPLAGSAILPPTSEQPAESPQSSESRAAPAEKLDEYVPQTDSVVPEDIAPEEEDEDVLDFYGEEPVSRSDKAAPTHPVDADVPHDLDEDEHLHEANSSSSSMSRSLSQPTTRAPKESSGGPRSHSVYLPGHYDDEEDEGYQGGTVTIVQSSR